MPKLQMTKEEYQQIQNDIIKASINIIAKDGYHNTSMRKIASSLNMSATRIYNYFENKDEIYLRVMILGYQEFHQYIILKLNLADEPHLVIRAFLEAFVDYYFDNPNFYALLFIKRLPRTNDFLGKSSYEYAQEKHDIGKKFLVLLSELIKSSLSEEHINLDEQWIQDKSLMIFSQIHGLICLHNNNLLHEVNAAPRELIQSTIEVILQTIEI